MSTFFAIAISVAMVAGTVWAWWALRPPKPRSKRPEDDDPDYGVGDT